MYDMVFPNNVVFDNQELVSERKYIVDTIRNFIEMMTKNDTKNETFYRYYKELIKGETNEC